MLDRADAILKLVLAGAAIVMASAVGYYYGIFMPAQAVAAAQQVAEAKRSEQVLAQKTEAKRASEANNAKQQFNICVASAQSDYNSRWQSSCKSIHDRQLLARNNCYDQGGNAFYCANYTVTDARECSLPSDTAQSYDLGLQNAKRLCMDNMAIATGQTAVLGPPLH